MSKARNLANLLADGAVGASELASTLDLSGKTMTLPAGVGGHASGNEASRPASPSVGTTYFNTDEDTLQQYTATGWKNIGGGVTTDTEANRPASPAVGTLFFNTTQDTLQQFTAQGWQDVGLEPFSISSVTGQIFSATNTTLTISGSNFGLAATVRFVFGQSAYDVSVVPTSSIELSVLVPSQVYTLPVGTQVAVSVIQNNRISGQVNKTVADLPTGGTISSSGGYRYHTFLSSGNLIVPSGVDLNTEYLLVAGGGGGGCRHAGGGGAGGMLTGSHTINPGTYSVVIGSGATGATASSVTGNRGLDTTALGFTAIGGGAGISDNGDPSGRHNGGSGGGGAYYANFPTGGTGTVGQGNNGGSQSGSVPAGGGGGGKSQAGQSLTGYTDNGGNGGAGAEWPVGSGTFYAGGGGGGSAPNSGNGGIGGSGVGGNGTTTTIPGNGAENRGGGGGGTGNTVNGGNGGSGIFIIRYPS